MQIRTPRDVGALLRQHRRRLNLSQAELADRIRMNRRWVLEVEQGKPGAALGHVLEALAAVGVLLTVENAGGASVSTRATAPAGLELDIDAIVDGARER